MLVALLAAQAVFAFGLSSLHKQLIAEQEQAAKIMNLREWPGVEGGSMVQQVESLIRLLKSATAQLLETRKKETSLLENAADVICLINTDGVIIKVNQACRSVWGYTQEELLGKPLGGFFVDTSDSQPLAEVLSAEKSIERITFENRFLAKGKKSLDLLWSVHWSATDAAMFCVAHDISQRKQAELMLRQSEEWLRHILEYLPAAVLLVGKQGVVEFLNGKFASWIGLTRQTESGIGSLRVSEFLDFCPEPFASKHLDKLIESHANSSFDSFATRTSGERFPVEVSLSRLTVGKQQCFLVIFLDVSSKHTLETAKREFVAMVSHDLRTPLSSVVSTLQFLEDGLAGPLSDTGQSLTTTARKESERLMELVRDLLELEKMKAGKFSMQCNHLSRLKLLTKTTENSHGSAVGLADCFFTWLSFQNLTGRQTSISFGD